MTLPHTPQPIAEQLPGQNSVWLDGRQGIVELQWRAGLMEQVLTYAASTYISRSGKGSDVGGVFYGHREGEVIRVMTWRPISRSKEATSHFYLNSKEEQSLVSLFQAAAEDPSLIGMEVAGWFRSRTKGEPELDPQDIALHQKFFEKSWQFAMVVRPSHQRPSEASIFIRNGNNELEGKNPTATLRLQPSQSIASKADVGTASIAGVALDEKARPVKRPFPILMAASMLGMVAVVSFAVILTLQWNQRRETALQPVESLGLELVFDGEDLKARWNPTSAAIMNADSAQLLLGGERVQLSHAELAQGFLRVPMKSGVSDDTEVSLKVGNREEVAQLVVAAR